MAWDSAEYALTVYNATTSLYTVPARTRYTRVRVQPYRLVQPYSEDLRLGIP